MTDFRFPEGVVEHDRHGAGLPLASGVAAVSICFVLFQAASATATPYAVRQRRR
jgi:hypothetical protein